MPARVNLFLLLTAVLLLSSCKAKDNEFSEFRDIPAKGWAYGTPVLLAPEQNDSVASGPLFLTLRHNNSFPFSNIYVEIEGKNLLDTINIPLADIYGNWYGKGKGDLKEVTVLVRRNYTHTSGDTILVRHILRVDTLDGVSSVGLQLNPAGNYK